MQDPRGETNMAKKKSFWTDGANDSGRDDPDRETPDPARKATIIRR